MKYPEYDSPLSFIVGGISTQVAEELDKTCLRVINKCSVSVDEQTLISALEQDSNRYREAYRKGYETGYEERDEKIVRCKDCEKHYNELKCPCGGYRPDDFYCGAAERKTDDE